MIDKGGHSIALGEGASFVEKPRSGGSMPVSLTKIIWRNRWIILLPTVVAVAAAFAYFATVTPLYTSTSKILVEQVGPKVLTVAEGEGVMTQSQNYLFTQAELLRSMPILSLAVEKVRAKQTEIFDRVDNPIAYLKGQLSVTVGKRDDIISISCDYAEPVAAAQLVNAVVDSYVTYQATRKRDTSGEVLKVLQKEQTARRTELFEKLKAMADFKKEHVAMAFEYEDGNIIRSRLENLSDALTDAQLATIQSKSKYETIKQLVGDPAAIRRLIEGQLVQGEYISPSSERATLVSSLDALRPRLADRLRQLNPSHPAVVALESEIAQIEAKIADMDAEFARAELAAAQAELALAEQEYTAAREREDEIAKHFEDQRQQTIQLNEQLAQYTVLQSDWEQTRRLCDLLDDRIKEVSVTEDVGALNISILEVARPADKPSTPRKNRDMAIALFLGLTFGGGGTLLRESKDQKLRSAKEVSAVLDMPVLGVVPSMRGRQSMAAQGQKVLCDAESHAAEVYRMIRTSVFFSARKDMARTVLVTSPHAGVGKTTLVSNLAIAMAQAGHKTLILDANFRNPMQHHVFGMDENGEGGLVSVLSGDITLEEAIRPTGVEELDLLTCGSQLLNASEVLSSAAFAGLLEDLSNKYSHIVIDSPPTVLFTDALILAAICNTTLLAVRTGKSTRAESQEARDRLRNAGGHILGTVVT